MGGWLSSGEGFAAKCPGTEVREIMCSHRKIVIDHPQPQIVRFRKILCTVDEGGEERKHYI